MELRDATGGRKNDLKIQYFHIMGHDTMIGVRTVSAITAWCFTFALLPAGVSAGGGCVADCSKEFHCSTCSAPPAPDWSCDICCPGCSLTKFDGGNYCTCKGPVPPTPPSPPPPSGDGYYCKEGGCIQYQGGPFPTKAACESKCSGPPSPPSGPDTWATYNVGAMNVLSVVGGKDPLAYDKVVVLLHGGGGQGTDWEYQYANGWQVPPPLIYTQRLCLV